MAADPFTAGSSILGAPRNSLVPKVVCKEPGDQQGQKVYQATP